jgi:hypothetical protein
MWPILYSVPPMPKLESRLASITTPEEGMEFKRESSSCNTFLGYIFTDLMQYLAVDSP